MSSTLPLPTGLRRLPPEALSHLAQGQRQIVRIAGLFADEARAQRAHERLREEVGLPVNQLLMLRPSDGHPLRYGRAARAWQRLREPDRSLRPEHRTAGGIVGALVVGLVAWGMSLLDADQNAGAIMGALMVGALWGALLGVLVVVVLERLPPDYRFDHTIQRGLRGGGHALVVLQVPGHCQAEVLALMRGTSRGWCAEAPRLKRKSRVQPTSAASPPAP